MFATWVVAGNKGDILQINIAVWLVTPCPCLPIHELKITRILQIDQPCPCARILPRIQGR